MARRRRRHAKFPPAHAAHGTHAAQTSWRRCARPAKPVAETGGSPRDLDRRSRLRDERDIDFLLQF
jgi:hypothetical protein